MKITKKNTIIFSISIITFVLILSIFQVITEQGDDICSKLSTWANKNLMEIASLYINLLVMLFLIVQINDNREMLAKNDEELIIQKQVFINEQKAKLIMSYSLANNFRIDNIGRSAAYKIRISYEFYKKEKLLATGSTKVVALLSGGKITIDSDRVNSLSKIDYKKYDNSKITIKYSDLFSENNIADFNIELIHAKRKPIIK